MKKSEAAETPLHPEDVRAAIRKEHTSLRAFEAANELPTDSVRDVLRGKRSRRTAEIVARFIGRPLNEVFPHHFDSFGEHKSRKRDAHRLNSAVR